MSTNKGAKGRYPFPIIAGVRDTTRKVAASFNSRAMLPRASGSSLQESTTNTIQEEVSHVEDPEEPPTLLTRLASERPNPLVDLESLLPVSHTFEDENGFIALCNDLLVLNVQEHSDPTVRSINIPGSKVFISPHQLYHAYHLLSQRGRDLNGGILADDAGTGKTYIFFAACLLRALAFESQRMVRLYWSGKGKKKVGRHAEHHLPQGANGRSCPSQKTGGIVCYCVPGSLTRTIADHTPSGVSALYCALETWPDILNMVQTSALNPSVYQLCLVHNNAPVRFTQPLQPLVKTLARGAKTDLKSFSPESYIFITTLNSPRLRNVFSSTLNAGFVIVDEAHQILRTKDSLTFRMASEFSNNGADVWFVTATPFSGCSLADWVAPMKLIAPSRAAAMQALPAALDTAISSGDANDAQDFRDLFNAVFDRNLVVRHFGTSKFFGKFISDVQDIVPRVISRETPAQHKSAVQELANQIAYRDHRLRDPGQRGLLYLVSLFPAAAQLILDDPITFDTASIRDLVRQVKNRLRIQESEPLRRLADQIVKDSPKLDYILEELNRMDQDKREREPIDNHSAPRFGAGEDLQMKKMVIITPTAVSAVFLYLALIRHRPDVALIHNWVSSKEKEQIVNNFMSLSAAKLVKHNRVLIAPFAAAGTGVNLQVASYQILTSPLPDKTSQLQAFARTNRSGQRLSALCHKILALEDSPVDRIVVASHASLEFESDPFNVNEPIRIAGNVAPSKLGTSTSVVEEQSSSSHGSTLGVDEPLLLQDAMMFSPESPIRDGRGAQGTEQESESETSSIDGEAALLFQNALFWSPGSPTGDGQSTEHAEGGNQFSLFNDLSTTSGRQNEPERSMSTEQESDGSTSTHWQLTYSPAPQHPVMPTHHDLGHRPLPPLPTETEAGGQTPDPGRGRPTLFPPLPSGPPARIDAGPTLASRRDQSVSTTPPATGYQINVNQDNFEIWVSDLASRSSEAGPSRQLDPLTLRLPDDFSPTFSNITATVDGIRRENGLPQQGRPTALDLSSVNDAPFPSFDEDDLSHQGHVSSPIERPPTPYPDEMRDHEDDISDSGWTLRYRDFDVEDLIRTARSSARLVANDLFEENAQQPGQEFH